MVKLVPSKKTAPKAIPYICALLYILVVVLCIFSIYYIYSKNNTFIVCLAGLVFDFLCLFIISRSFSWYKSAELKKTNDFVVYNVENIIGLLGRNITKYHIIRLDDMHKSGRNLIIRGYIDVFEPMQKASHTKKLVINDITDEGITLIEEFFNK